VVACVERKSLVDLVSSLVGGRPTVVLGMAALGRAHRVIDAGVDAKAAFEPDLDPGLSG